MAQYGPAFIHLLLFVQTTETVFVVQGPCPPVFMSSSCTCDALPKDWGQALTPAVIISLDQSGRRTVALCLKHLGITVLLGFLIGQVTDDISSTSWSWVFISWIMFTSRSNLCLPSADTHVVLKSIAIQNTHTHTYNQSPYNLHCIRYTLNETKGHLLEMKIELNLLHGAFVGNPNRIV